MKYTIKVNGQSHLVDVDSDTPLLWVLREELGLTGTKFGCGIGQCGACTVSLDGEATRSCLLPIEAVGTASIETIEAIATTQAGQAIVSAWERHQVPQCGYCQSGQIVAADAYLRNNPGPLDAATLRAAMTNLCRCGTYEKIETALLDVAARR
jgi:isoquinoline 1-oxidoreductase subunit alpha